MSSARTPGRSPPRLGFASPRARWRGLAGLGALVLLAARADAAPEEVALRWLGVAGFSLQAGDAVLLHDPYLSRPGLLRLLLRRYRPDTAVLERFFGAGSPAPELARARLVLIGHSHFDHLGDAPWLARRSGAELAGTATSVAIARGYGLPTARAQRVEPGQTLERGPFAVRVVESRHARVLFGRVPLPGERRTPPDGLLHAASFPMGGALGYLVTHRPSGLRLYFLSSAALHPPALEALAEAAPVDVLLPAVQGRDERYARRLVAALRPRLVIPHHYDDFLRDLDHAEAGAPRDGKDLERFERELRAAAREAGLELAVRRPALFERIELARALSGG